MDNYAAPAVANAGDIPGHTCPLNHIHNTGCAYYAQSITSDGTSNFHAFPAPEPYINPDLPTDAAIRTANLGDREYGYIRDKPAPESVADSNTYHAPDTCAICNTAAYYHPSSDRYTIYAHPDPDSINDPVHSPDRASADHSSGDGRERTTRPSRPKGRDGETGYISLNVHPSTTPDARADSDACSHGNSGYCAECHVDRYPIF